MTQGLKNTCRQVFVWKKYVLILCAGTLNCHVCSEGLVLFCVPTCQAPETFVAVLCLHLKWSVFFILAL